MLVPAVASLLVLGTGVGYMISEQQAAASGGQESSAARTAAFLVTDTGTEYWKTTLRAQLRDRLAAQGIAPSAGSARRIIVAPAALTAQPGTHSASQVPSTPATGPSGTAPATRVAPSRSLVGCVMRLTGNAPPEFVDRATYQSEPVYVIAVREEAWVVAIACTAARPAVITSVRLSNDG